MRYIWYTFILSLCVLMTSVCAPRTPSEREGREYVDKMRFVRHDNGLCFGVVEIRERSLTPCRRRRTFGSI